jgi:hypothetical protein
LQARLPTWANDIFQEAQSSLSALSVPLCVIPTPALHVSIYAAVPVSWPDSPKEPFWRQIQSSVQEIVRETADDFRSVELVFHSLRILPMAVVALAQDRTGVIRSVRARLKEACRHPSLSSPSYDQIHCTLARFAASSTIEEAEAIACQASWRPVATPVSALALVREVRYPSLAVARAACRVTEACARHARLPGVALARGLAEYADCACVASARALLGVRAGQPGPILP